jgi:hypothetical protein
LAHPAATAGIGRSPSGAAATFRSRRFAGAIFCAEAAFIAGRNARSGARPASGQRGNVRGKGYAIR